MRDDREPRKINFGDRGTVAGPWYGQERRGRKRKKTKQESDETELLVTRTPTKPNTPMRTLSPKESKSSGTCAVFEDYSIDCVSLDDNTARSKSRV